MAMATITGSNRDGTIAKSVIGVPIEPFFHHG